MKALMRSIIARLFEHQVRRVIARHKLKVVTVSGSVGKTSTKTAIAHVLDQKYRVMAREGGYNSQIGLPLSVFNMSVPRWLFNPVAWIWRLIQSEIMIYRYPYEVLVLELGTDHPGEIAHFLTYLTPDLGVITAVTPEHSANFPGGMDQIAEEELQLAAQCAQVLATHDDIAENYRRKYLDKRGNVTYFGAKVRKGFSYRVRRQDLQTGAHIDVFKNAEAVATDIPVRLFGQPAFKAAVAAYAVGEYFRVSKRHIETGLAEVLPVSGRMNILEGKNGSILIDDSYNAQPDAVFAAIAELMAAPATRRIAVLGSMNELGESSQMHHEAVGVAVSGVDLLITLGTDARNWLGPTAVKAGLDPTRLQAADSPYAAGEFLLPQLRAGDVVLIKGSQNGVFSEEVTKLLLANAADASQLVRQSPAWLRIKRQAFRT